MDLLGVIAFAISTGSAHILTNIDNLAVLVGVSVTLGFRKALSGFFASQAVLLFVIVIVAESLDGILPSWAGYLGIIPIGLGLRDLMPKSGDDLKRDPVPRSSVIGVVFLFLGLSTDSFAVLAPLLTETSAGFRAAGLIGVVTASAVLGLLAAATIRVSRLSQNLLPKLERLGPVVMILAGIYILLNSGTDMVQ